MIPWYVKIPAKMALSRLPVSRSLLNRVGIFRHGSMVRPDYALEIVQRHLQLAKLELRGKSILELGPGDSVGNGIIAFALGAAGSTLVDAGDFAAKSLNVYRPFVEWLISALPDTDRLREVGLQWSSFEEMIEAFNIRYLTQGLDSLRSIPDGSIDYCFSEAVLEHFRVGIIAESMREVRRCLRVDGIATHVIDYKDHLQGGLNNMRFSGKTWEGSWFAESGFYTNRLRHSDMLEMFGAAGFDVVVDEPVRWAQLPTPIEAIHPELRRYPESVLQVREASVVLRPRP